WALLDHAGHKVASPDVYWLKPFSEGLAAFAEKKGWGNRPFVPVLPFGHPRGYIDKSGTIRIPAKFSYAGRFSEGLAAVALDGSCWVSGEFRQRDPAPSAAVRHTSCGPEAAESVVEPCRHGYIDRIGRFRIPARFELAQEFSEERAAVRLHG